MAKVIPLPVPNADTLDIPLGDGASLSLIPFRDSPRVALAVFDSGGKDGGGAILTVESARLLGSWLQRVADKPGKASSGARGDRPAATRFPARAPSLLAAALDDSVALPAFIRLAVPSFADWCSVDVVAADRSIRRLAVVHADPRKADVARMLAGYPPDVHGLHPKATVLRTGKPDVAPEISEARLVAYARDADHLAILRTLGCRSSITVPLVARRRVLGMITFVTAESGRRYSADNLPAAMAFARYAALAADNARHYRQAAQALAPGAGVPPPARRS